MSSPEGNADLRCGDNDLDAEKSPRSDEKSNFDYTDEKIQFAENGCLRYGSARCRHLIRVQRQFFACLRMVKAS
jgi:hypothetical protein